MRSEPVRAACLGRGMPVLGRMHDGVFEYMVSRFQNASPIPLVSPGFGFCF